VYEEFLIDIQNLSSASISDLLIREVKRNGLTVLLVLYDRAPSSFDLDEVLSCLKKNADEGPDTQAIS
jgi:hypothetical protein